MRPAFEIVSVSYLTSSFNPGLSQTGELNYTGWQKLPEAGECLHGATTTSKTPEAAMKSARPDSKKPGSIPTANAAPGVPGSHETRAQRLERIKREIADGTYESEEKLERAIERMLGVLVD
ncbi:hypothetical protein SH661x_001132 [Planctomicrobium sp. SH661]|uniref:hypothetical protein n=1 Tax=Planctomicrobium sp. SH661 TaxID=3448124 RepID=UPI003F5C2ADF